MSHIYNWIQNTALQVAAPILRYSYAIVFIWFGIPKLFPGVSPAEPVAVSTVRELSMGLLSYDAARLAIGLLEVALGLALAVGWMIPLFSLLSILHLIGTFIPLVMFPSETWMSFGVGTLTGQYILKNIVLIAGLIALIALYSPAARKASRNVSLDRALPPQ
ncbi:DoxX family membrane protein [Lysinibacter sp. HNR]|uniref:DoxX family membrane protein n=1 Tax=Lysinibacter sp. HNR TaxID=3031408 RepID=UPI002434DEE6|nr:DoxX family membrane protein [Lysinibacter sp. HNR]WGD36341.1 DoxX family membrane protein [Lysinibacter sp. HNR]